MDHFNSKNIYMLGISKKNVYFRNKSAKNTQFYYGGKAAIVE